MTQVSQQVIVIVLNLSLLYIYSSPATLLFCIPLLFLHSPVLADSDDDGIDEMREPKTWELVEDLINDEEDDDIGDILMSGRSAMQVLIFSCQQPFSAPIHPTFYATSTKTGYDRVM